MSNDQWGVGDLSKAHDHGTIDMNGTPWRLVWGEHPHSRSDNKSYAVSPSGEVYDFDGHRIRIGVEITERNYLKESHLSGDEIRKGGSCIIKADDVPVFEFFHRDAEWALLRAREIIGQLRECPASWLSARERERLVGRAVYYERMPAVITRLIVDQGCIILEPDGGEFPAPVYADDPSDHEHRTSIKAEVLDPKIWWFRDKLLSPAPAQEEPR